MLTASLELQFPGAMAVGSVHTQCPETVPGGSGTGGKRAQDRCSVVAVVVVPTALVLQSTCNCGYSF